MDSIGGLSGLSGFGYSTGSTGGTTGTDKSSSISDKQVFNAGVVTSTLDKLNDSKTGGSSDYDFQKTVLSARGIGNHLDITA